MTDTKFSRAKDPDAVKPYLWNWADYLDNETVPPGDTIADVDFIVYDATEGAVTVTDSAFDTTTATAWLTGGVAPSKQLITCRITTTAGVVEDRTLYLSIKEM